MGSVIVDLAPAVVDVLDVVLQAGGPSSGPSAPSIPDAAADGVQDVVDTALSAPGEVVGAVFDGVANAADRAYEATLGHVLGGDA